MNIYHFLLIIALFYTVVMIFAYKEELREKDYQLRYKEEQLEDLREYIKIYIKDTGSE